MSHSDIRDLPEMTEASLAAESQELLDQGLNPAVLRVFRSYLRTAAYNDRPYCPTLQSPNTCPHIEYVMVPAEYDAALREFGILNPMPRSVAVEVAEIASPGPTPRIRRLFDTYYREGDYDECVDLVRDLAYSLHESVGMYLLASKYQVQPLQELARHRFCRTTLDLLLLAERAKDLPQQQGLACYMYTGVANAVDFLYWSTKATDPLRRAACVLIGDDKYLAEDGPLEFTPHGKMHAVMRRHGTIRRGIEDFRAQPQLRAWRELMETIHIA